MNTDEPIPYIFKNVSEVLAALTRYELALQMEYDDGKSERLETIVKFENISWVVRLGLRKPRTVGWVMDEYAALRREGRVAYLGTFSSLFMWDIHYETNCKWCKQLRDLCEAGSDTGVIAIGFDVTRRLTDYWPTKGKLAPTNPYGVWVGVARHS